MTTIVGLDLSLTSTGVATIETGDGRERRIVERITSKGRKDATLHERAARLHMLARDICQKAVGVDFVIVEGPSFASKGSAYHQLAGMWWLVIDGLGGAGTHIVEVPPSCRMKYATGKGNAAKDAVLAAVVRRYPQIDVTGNDEADALVLAAMGARHLGHPIEDTLPTAHLAAMNAVRWPSRGH